MFSGIVETTATIEQVIEKPSLLQLTISKPLSFDDLKLGDSIAVDGVCLTLEKFSERSMEFSVAAETLHITGWKQSELLGRGVNLERSLKFGDRIHGHLVAGHVDAVGTVESVETAGEARIVQVSIPGELKLLIWKKGSMAINGVSLTVNQVTSRAVELCLIPETLRRTNLGKLKIGDKVNLETDTMARAILHSVELKSEASP
jgi:riboflavin synthase